jgi:hypothetical protein
VEITKNFNKEFFHLELQWINSVDLLLHCFTNFCCSFSMRFPCCFFFIVAVFCITADALSYEDEKKATRILFENAEREQLASILSTCQESPQEVVSDECRRADYVKRIDGILAKLQTQPLRLMSDEAAAPPKVRVVDESYQSLFENYVAHSVPFKGKLGVNASAASEIALAVSVCAQQTPPSSQHPVTGDFPLRDCANAADLRSVLHIPALAYNSYNVRLASAQTDSSSSSGSSVDLVSHWPSFLQVPPPQAEPLSHAAPRSCPANMHLLLWGPSAPLAARLFRRDLAAHALAPTPGEQELHQIQFHAPQQEQTSDDVSLMADRDEYLFVPHDYLVSLAQLQDDAVPATVFQMCFFDASNVNFVRESLSVAALLLEPQARAVVSLLQSSGPGGFDFNMTRKPPSSSISYEEYTTYPREGGAGSDSAAAANKPKSKPRGRDRSKGGANNFRGKKVLLHRILESTVFCALRR